MAWLGFTEPAGRTMVALMVTGTSWAVSTPSWARTSKPSSRKTVGALVFVTVTGAEVLAAMSPSTPAY